MEGKPASREAGFLIFRRKWGAGHFFAKKKSLKEGEIPGKRQGETRRLRVKTCNFLETGLG